MNAESLTVAELFRRLQSLVVEAFPTPTWIRGEVSGFRRTSGGAGFFRLADPEADDVSLDVAARGMVMADVDRSLNDAGLGGLRDGVVVRIRGTVGVDERRSMVRLNLLEVDPAFTAGRLALDRAAILRKLAGDGSLEANGAVPFPLVPLRVGLVTSRGSAAHGDFVDQLRRSRFRFAVRTVHTSVQGETAATQIAGALSRFQGEPVDAVALVRGGGSKLDLAVFDTEDVARAIAGLPVPVVTGLGHEMDRTIADEAAAISTKTPSAAGEFLVARVSDFANRLGTARQAIRNEARSAVLRHRHLLRAAASDIAGGAMALRRQGDRLDRLAADIATASRSVLDRQRVVIDGLAEWFAAVDVEPTLRRGFAIVTDTAERVVRSVDDVDPGDELIVRLSDGTVRVRVETDEH